MLFLTHIISPLSCLASRAPQTQMAKPTVNKTSSSPLFIKGAVTGFRGSQMNQYQHQSIVKIDGVRDIKDTYVHSNPTLLRSM